jgi:hypothetical protein
VFPRLFLTRKRHRRFVVPGPDRQNIWASRCGRQLPVNFVPGATRSTQEKQRGRAPCASLFSIHLWIPRVLIVQREKGHHNGTQTRPFVSLPKRLPRPGEKGQQLSPSSCLPRCFAVPPGWGKKRPSMLPCRRRTDARLGHGVVAIYSGLYWIINTLGGSYQIVRWFN